MVKTERLWDWIGKNKIPDNMLWKTQAEQQIFFVLETLGVLVSGNNNENESSFVIGSHQSKSIQLPVYLLKREKVQFVMRNNFFDWKLSVISDVPVVTNFVGLFDSGKSFATCYFQGFPGEMIFGPYQDNNKKFSLEVFDDYTLYTVIFLCLQAIGGKGANG